MIHLDLADNAGGTSFVVVKMDYSPEVTATIKTLPNRHYLPDLKAWVFPLDQYASRSVSILKDKYNATISERLTVGLDQLGTALDSLQRIALDQRGENVDFNTDLPLYPYQKAVALFMLTAKQCLNACFVGSGKTLTSLAVLRSLSSKKSLVIAPKSLVFQWAVSEGGKWLPDWQFVPVIGDKKTREKAMVTVDRAVDSGSPIHVVTSYEMVRLMPAWFSGHSWDVIIADEAHRLANTATKLYKAMSGLKAPYKYGLTATPVMNKAEDLYGIMHWIRPGCLGTKTAFINRYCVLDQWHSVRFYKNLGELANRVKPFIIKRTLEEVGMELPPLTITDLWVSLSDSEKKLYNNIRSELLFEIERLEISKIDNPTVLQNTIVKLGKLFELCDSMELLGERSESSKLDLLRDHIADVIASGQKAIIITRFERMAQILHRELAEYNPLLITGTVSNRQPIVDNFNSTGKILIGTEAIGQGLNLQTASVLYNYDLPWSPAKLEQRIGRIHRQGQIKPSFIYNLLADMPVEKWLRRKLQDKEALSQSLVPTSYSQIKEILL